jgi:translation initiation factor 2 beta subunit (eIF-2beta)/eIF-5
MNKLLFEDMLNDAFKHLDDTKNQVLVLPSFDIDTNTVRLHWKNIKEYLKIIKRSPSHFINWLKQELPTKLINWYSSSKSDGLIVHGKFQKKTEVTELALKYVETFVICSSCKSPNTDMTKEDSKKFYFNCNSCGMTQYIV